MTPRPLDIRISDAPFLCDYLRKLGARKIRHSGTTFYAHLLGTAELLTQWDQNDHVIKAGLYHSIYGTEYFKQGLIQVTERNKIVELLGNEAEELVYLFCYLKRASVYTSIEKKAPYSVVLLDDRVVEVSENTLRHLVAMIWANALEQAKRTTLTHDSKRKSRRSLGRSFDFLPPKAIEPLQTFYGQAHFTQRTPCLCPDCDPSSTPTTLTSS